MTKQKLSTINLTTSRLKHIADALNLPAPTQRRAFELAGLKPDNAAWLRFIDRLLLICGATLAIVGVMSFFAYNWADLHKFGKFALLQSGVIALVLMAYFKGMDKLTGKAALFGAAVLAGVLLAVYGQTYQTGADPYGLFLTWAILISGWALIGRNAGLWLLLLVLANLSLVMYWTQLVHPENWVSGLVRELGPFAGITFSLTDFSLAQWVFSLNVLALVVWEYFSLRNSASAWMQGRSFPRIIAVFALAPIVISTLMFILLAGVDGYWGIRWVSPVFFAVFTAAVLFYYSKKSLDMFILASALLALIVIVTAVAARTIDAGFEMFFLLSILVIAQSAAAAQWLRTVRKTWGQTHE